MEGSVGWVGFVGRPGGGSRPGGWGAWVFRARGVARLLLVVMFVVVGLVVVAGRAAAAQGAEILYVAPGGSDPTCVSPCASVQGAVNRGSQDLQSGAASSVLIEVAPGFYSGNVVIPALPGTAPVTIQGAGASTELGGTGAGSVVTVPAGSRVAITDLSIVGGNA